MKIYKTKLLLLFLSLVLLVSSCTRVIELENSPSPSSIVTQKLVESSVVTTIMETVKVTPSPTIIIEKDTKDDLLNSLDSEQVIIIEVEDESSLYSKLSFYEKVNNTWIEKLSDIPSTVGKKGINKEKEGDSKTPTGIYSLGSAFGYENDLDTKYPFLEITYMHNWIDDVNSKYYNQLVNYIDGNKKVFDSSEQLITFDVYKYGVFINYNLENEKGLGSAIFLHIYRSVDSPTGGCVALDEENLKYIIENLDKSKNPLIVIGNVNEIQQPNRLTDEFVYIKDLIPDILIDAKYYSDDNFLGKQVDGYMSNTAILKYDATLALNKIQKELLEMNLSLIVYDAYRPQKAVDHFVSWVNDSNDIINKEDYYPNVDKSKLIEYGYIGALSNHSKGNTIDLSIIDLKTGKPLDMGSIFDFFGDISHYNTNKITNEQFDNRKLLKDIMEKYNFSPYINEWWHFSYDREKYLNSIRYDFDVKF